MLEVKNLKVSLREKGGLVAVVDQVSFSLGKGATLGIVGESGCGKSVTAQALLGLLDPRIFEVAAESLQFEGRELLTLQEREWRTVRGNRIAMIFQNPMTSLDPLMKAGHQISETLLQHGKAGRREAKRRAIALLGDVGIPEPAKRFSAYPHELSGGMQQRVMIAMALAAEPALLLADEPTTALDVTVQAQILDLMRELRAKHGMALILITHNLGIVAEMVEQLAVMYAGQIVELGKTGRLLSRPSHPYTAGLLRALPDPALRRERLFTIEGTVPSPGAFPAGCRFADRCPLCEPECRSMEYGLRGDGLQASSCRRRDQVTTG